MSEKKPVNGYFIRCVVCNDTLAKHYQTVGTCSECSYIINKASNPRYIAEDNAYVENKLWKNPMGGELFSEDVEMDYNGSSDDY